MKLFVRVQIHHRLADRLIHCAPKFTCTPFSARWRAKSTRGHRRWNSPRTVSCRHPFPPPHHRVHIHNRQDASGTAPLHSSALLRTGFFCPAHDALHPVHRSQIMAAVETFGARRCPPECSCCGLAMPITSFALNPPARDRQNQIEPAVARCACSPAPAMRCPACPSLCSRDQPQLALRPASRYPFASCAPGTAPAVHRPEHVR